MIALSHQVRQAVEADQNQIANLMYFESHVHRHLDWRAPLDWIGSPLYWVLEERERIVAVLACPPGPFPVAWVRLFAHSSRISLEDAWRALWQTARVGIASQGGAEVAVIAMHNWLENLVNKSGFQVRQQIIMLIWKRSQPPLFETPHGVVIRAMTPSDLPAVAELDAEAFAPLWQNPLDALEKALPQASVATVLEGSGGLVGYQISTSNPFGAHLARLAVRPGAQRHGYGRVLVADLIRQLGRLGIRRLSVNTQNDNHASLALYEKLGFVRTGEQFPVYCIDIAPAK